MASGTCAKCHGEGCQSCWGSGWCPDCGGCGLICPFCRSPTVRTSGTHSSCEACSREDGQCADCADLAWIDCPHCQAGDVEEEAVKIAAAGPTSVIINPQFYPEFDTWWDEYGEMLVQLIAEPTV